MNIVSVVLVIVEIAYAVFGKAFLPREAVQACFLLRFKGETSFNALQSHFQGDVWIRRDHEVKVIRHNDEFVQQEAPNFPILKHNHQKEQREDFIFEQRIAKMIDRGHEKRPLLLRSVSQ